MVSVNSKIGARTEPTLRQKSGSNATRNMEKIKNTERLFISPHDDTNSFSVFLIYPVFLVAFDPDSSLKVDPVVALTFLFPEAMSVYIYDKSV